ncbi:MAG: riboflavin synthase [Sodalis sp. Psp]|nr:riboflavin synthase [Sodalis sp. Psp]MCR3757102.1 riboflavin synthase [Sodalis sp. Ppy]
MFTGIVQVTAPIIAIKEKANFCTHYVRLPETLLLNLAIGTSMAYNGCCLTVAGIVDNTVSFDLTQETLRITNLGALTVGNEINLERAISLNEEIGGHLMSGHIICTAEVAKVITSENNRQIWFRVPDKKLMKYIMSKGYIGVDGISLTVGEVSDNLFSVHLIPATLMRTTLSKKQLGDSVNIEIDSQTQAIVDTVDRILAAKGSQSENG